jgi:dihydroneopterin aldolase
MDMLFLEGLDLFCRVGCSPEERFLPQSLRADVKLICRSLAEAGRRDDLSETVDYRVATEMIAAVRDREFLLIERIAEELAAIALRHPKVEQVEVTVRKRPPVEGLDTAGVRITRSRS